MSQISSNWKISEYLSSQGIHPELETHGRLKYSCPLYDDDTPSFIVYENEDEGDSFYCFGCKKGGRIVQLKMLLEGMNASKAISQLSAGLDIDIGGELSFLCRRLEEEVDQEDEDSLEDIVLSISRKLYGVRKAIRDEEPWLSGIEKIFKLADDALYRCDRKSLKEIEEMVKLNSRPVIKSYNENKRASKIDAVKTYSIVK
jgi:hypothetical protein